nr:peptidoglycan-binding domain-containing protein [Rhodocyclus purpureus]
MPLGAARRKSSTAAVQVLQQGSRGSEVKKLQRQLNVRLLPSPNLTVDGIFGSITQQAVLQYQKGVSIVADGVVGKQTWYHLLKGDKATILQAPNTARSAAGASPTGTSSTIRQSLRAAPTPAPPESIWELPIEKKLLTVLERVPSRLPGRARDEFTALLQLENLALSLAIIAGFCLLSGGTALLLGKH